MPALAAITEPLQLDFFRHGLAAAVLASLSCATLGCHIVLRRVAYLGDAMAHGVLPGIVLAWMMGASLAGGAICAAIVMSLGIAWLARDGQVTEDSAIGILFTSLFALGILLLQKNPKGSAPLAHVLFGNILGVTTGDLVLLGIVATVVVALLVLFHKELELTTCDPIYAESIGLSPRKVRYVLMAVLGLAVTVGIQVVGVVLTSAMIVTPASAAALFARRLSTMMILAAVLSVVTGVAGLYASFHFDLSAGPAIVLAGTLIFSIMLAISRFRRHPA